MAPKNTNDNVVESASPAANSTATPSQHHDERIDWLTKSMNEFAKFNKQICGGFDEGPELSENGKTCVLSRMNEMGGFRFPFFDRTHQQQQIKINNDKEKFEIVFEVKGYEEDELKITTTGRFLKVEGKHEDNSNNSSKQFSRCYKLPDFCETENITKNYLEEGKLIVTMTKKPQDHKYTKSELVSGEEKVTLDNKINQQSCESQQQNSEAKSDTKDAATHNRCSEWTVYRPFWYHPIWILGQNNSSDESDIGNDSLRDVQSSTKFNNVVQDAQRTEDDNECRFTFDLKDYKVHKTHSCIE